MATKIWFPVCGGVDELMAAGVRVQGFRSEGNLGQYEIALGPLPPMQAVDELLLTSNIIKSTVARHNVAEADRAQTGERSAYAHIDKPAG